ncbi:MAG: tRNA (guanosine(46)-N7)-methyltransferase TrmB [Bacilli bacterium]|nr:tRNA (guanosine(46)-N7)-methyltransferase TrmB [Bacilli bacterium]
MRLKHIKNADIDIKKSKYYIENPEEYKGKYKELFKNDNSIHLEIGMGKGNFIIEMARRYPNINFIGMEKFDSVLVKATKKLNDIELPNLRLIWYDAAEIDNIFNKEIDTIYLNFSDPWPKKRHAKRRLTHENFLEKYDKIFKNTKNIIMKTDNRKLFEYSIKSLTDYGYNIDEISLDLHNDEIDIVETEYEHKFVTKGNIIYKVSVKK